MFRRVALREQRWFIDDGWTPVGTWTFSPAINDWWAWWVK